MTAQQLTSQYETDARTQLDAAARVRFVATGGADCGLSWALDFWATDLELAEVNSDPRTWQRAMQALRDLARAQ